ncbi:hypothetical protein ACJX0J_037533, partial [Zea mays]
FSPSNLMQILQIVNSFTDAFLTEENLGTTSILWSPGQPLKRAVFLFDFVLYVDANAVL